MISVGESLEKKKEFENVFKNGTSFYLHTATVVVTDEMNSYNVCLFSCIVWADNADSCAKQYAGTGALKTDFTRY